MNNTIVKKILTCIAGIVSITCSCASQREWEPVQYATSLTCDSLATIETSVELMDYPIKCRVYFEKDTLVIFMNPEGEWLFVTVKVHDGKFKAEMDGIPFGPGEFSFKTISQQLQLGKKHYIENDTLCGNFDLLIQNMDKETKQIRQKNFTGVICEVIRDKDFDPYSGENFMQWDYSTAIHEMGEPEPLNEDTFDDDDTFDTEELRGIRIELRRYFPLDKEILLKELTWDISPTRDISNEGRERLTIWYAKKNSKWMPIHYFKWHVDLLSCVF